MLTSLRTRTYSLLRSSEKHTKTDMVYLASSGFWLNTNVVVSTGLSLLLSIVFANALSPTVFGTYQYLVSIATALSAITLTGMNYAVTTAVAKGKGGILKDAVHLQIRYAWIPLGLGLLGGGYYLFMGNTTLGFGIIASGALVPLGAAFNTYGAYLIGRENFKTNAVYGVVIALCYTAAMIAATVLLGDALWLLLVSLAANALLFFVAHTRVLRTVPQQESSDPASLTYGKHLSVMQSLGVALRQADALLVFQFLGPASLALYTFASTIPERIGGLFKFVLFAGLPKFARATHSDVRKTILYKLALGLIVGSFGALIYIVVAPYIFQLLFPFYVEAIPYTRVFAAVIVTSVGYLLLSSLIGQVLTKRLYIYNIASPVIQILLLLVLIVPYGMWGVVFAKVAAGVFDLLLMLVLLMTPLAHSVQPEQ